MAENSVYAQTQTEETYKQDKKITAKQWKIYYYMLSVSKFDAQSVEDHRYVYKKNFNISQACRDLGIKSNQTFYNAIKKLEEYGLVINNRDTYFLYAKNYIEINKDVLGTLVKDAKTNDKKIDTLRVYLILKKMIKIAEKSEDKNFTIRQLCILLGHGDTTVEHYDNIRTILASLSFWGLIELKQHKQYNENLGTAYTIYHLQRASENQLTPSFEADIEAESQAELPSEEFMQKLKFCVPEIMDN